MAARTVTGHRAVPRRFEVIALGLILALAAYLRLAHNGDNPGWFSDEATHLDIAYNLLRGRVQYLALNRSTLLVARLPLFDLLLAGSLRLWDGGMVTLRTLTGLMGVLSVGLLYGVVRRTQAGEDVVLALLSALTLAVYPSAVLYSRFGFSYNLLALVVLVVLLGLWEYLRTSKRGWLALAATAAGLGGVSDLFAFTLVPPLILVILIRRWRDVPLALLLAGLPAALYAGLMIACAPDAFWFDVRYTVSRVSGIPLGAQIITLANNFTALFAEDWWITVGVIGLLALRPARLSRLGLLLFLVPLVSVGRAVALFSLSFYYMIPLFPLVALGVASLLRHGVPLLAAHVRGGLSALAASLGVDFLRGRFLSLVVAAVVLLLVAMPFATPVVAVFNGVRYGFVTSIDTFLISPADARKAAAYVNAHTDPGDLVIASPPVGWLLEANTANAEMVIAATGTPTVHLPGDIPADRFAFEPWLSVADLVVVDNLWRDWAAPSMPEARRMMDMVAEEWPLVYQAGQIEVYRGPER